MKRVSIAETQNVEMISMQNKHNMPLAELDHQDTLTQDIVNCMDLAALTKLNYSDEYCDSLEVFCQKRISSTHQALEQVQYLFVKSSTLKICRLQILCLDLRNVKTCFHPADTS